MKHPPTLIIGDTHLPFTHRNYLDFCVDTARRYKVGRVCHVGDLVDHHAISFHEHDPDGMSAGDEHKLATQQVKPWYKAFPKVYACTGNHDALIHRQAMKTGLPSKFLKSLKEVYGLPPGWRFNWEWRFGNWRIVHGTGTSGHDAAFKSAISARISTAQGHLHTSAGIKFHASTKDVLWGMQVACGIDRKAYAYSYGRNYKDKPLLGCGLVLEGGTLPMFQPMPL